jgi:hypothetical protein
MKLVIARHQILVRVCKAEQENPKPEDKHNGSAVIPEHFILISQGGSDAILGIVL